MKCFAIFLSSNLLHFLCFRKMGASELEDRFQGWNAGKKSGIWISVEIVVEKRLGITQALINSYLKEWYAARDPLLRGLYLHEVRREAKSVFIFDRSLVERSKGTKAPDAPDIRLWRGFLEHFEAQYLREREQFLLNVFELRRNSRVALEYSLADVLFGVKESRLALTKVLDNLLAEGLLPRPMPKPARASSLQPPPPLPPP